ncbi:MAG: DUF1232 domain-containing protein [Phycisphaeraceae bacterium]|nr:DUF1232 domain-containing protein [Phycisphaerales bacterium]MCB9843707.1 DUF1232 domain-containing protein [Phycisphaeraceae bacterium]
MSNPIRKLLNQCNTGFTVGQKVLVTVCALLYFLSPLDLLPDVPIIGWPDDLFALYLMIRVLFAPTLPKPPGPTAVGALAVRAPRQPIPQASEIIDVEYRAVRS